MFNVNESAFITSGKYAGKRCFIIEAKFSHNPTLFIVEVPVFNEEKGQVEFVECAVYESELESVFAHDLRMAYAGQEENR